MTVTLLVLVFKLTELTVWGEVVLLAMSREKKPNKSLNITAHKKCKVVVLNRRTKKKD